MVIYVFSDESGVFDQEHNDFFVFGGVILLSFDEKENVTRKYLAAERCVKLSAGLSTDDEAKACVLSNEHKAKLYRSLNQVHKFAVVIKQSRVLSSIFQDTKTKQRYLDYAFKIGLKRAFEKLIEDGTIDKSLVTRIEVFCDEHATATNGRYELREALEAEFRTGTYNYHWNKFHPPVFTSLQNVKLQFCNSKTVPLIRSADIIANRVYYHARNGCLDNLVKNKLKIAHLP